MSVLLGVLSFAFYHVNRFLLRGAQGLNARATAKKAPEWRILNGELLQHPLALPIVMTTGPRWNPHALIASAGPLSVQRELRVDACAAHSSAQAWTAVVNSFPDLRTVASLGAGSGRSDRLELPAGRYTVILRYYEWTAAPRLPALEVDGKEVVPAAAIPPSTNEFYKDLKQRESRYYLWLHYYISVILRHEKRLPASFVRGQYLPVGNPETEFFYGPMRPGERLDLKPLKPLLNDSRVYATIYNLASFPLFWCRVSKSMESLDPVEGAAYYLIRAHRGIPATATAGV
jgi:hypothetical protein